MARDKDTQGIRSQAEVLESIKSLAKARRPILTHLNADTTWLLSVPYPLNVKRPYRRSRFNILIDPWLKGPQSDVAGWFSTQWHAIKSSVQSITELDQLLKSAEEAEIDLIEPNSEDKHAETPTTFIDLVVISHEFTDHCHRSTLEEIHGDVPIFATTEAARLIKSWSHFQVVVDMAVFKERANWKTTSVPPLPSWLGVSRLVTEQDALYYHSAVIVCIQETQGESAEAVIYTPHGVQAATFSILNTADPAVHTLAFLHGLHDVSITLTKQLNLGAHNALKAQRLLNSKYWVGTHDEVKIGGGILAPFLRRKAHTLLDALAKESKGPQKGKDGRETDVQSRTDVSYVDLGSGDTLLLS